MHIADSIYKGNNVRGVSDAGEKLANMTIASRRPSIVQLPRPMKAGVRWSGSSGDLLIRPAQEIQHGSNYPRKVAGWQPLPLIIIDAPYSILFLLFEEP